MLRKRLLDEKFKMNEVVSVRELLETMGSSEIGLKEERGLSEEPCSNRAGLLSCEQDSNEHKIKIYPKDKRRTEKIMLYILVEAMLAAVILILIVWWTMFHGRERGEKKPAKETEVKKETSKE